MNESALVAVLEPIVAAHGLELDDLTVVNAGRRSVLRIALDGDGPDGRGPTIDDIAEATRAISAALDDSDAVGEHPYTLEVGSRGVSAPLERPAHWRRNVSRLVRITPSRASASSGGSAPSTTPAPNSTSTGVVGASASTRCAAPWSRSS